MKFELIGIVVITLTRESITEKGLVLDFGCSAA
jgi:hypothetical protein